MAANLTPDQLAWLQSQAKQAQSMPGSMYNGGVFTDPSGQTFTDQRMGGWQGGEAGFDSGPGMTTSYLRDVVPGQHEIGDMQDIYGADGGYKNTAAVIDDNWLDKLMPVLLGGFGAAAGAGLLSAGAAGAGAGSGGLAGDVLSKAALDGTTAFGANSVPGAFDLASVGGGAGGVGAGGGAGGGGGSLANYTGGTELNGLNGSDIMSDAFDANGAIGKGGFGGTDGSLIGSITGGSLSGAGKYIAPLLGGLLGSKGQKNEQTSTRDIPEWLKPYVQKNLGYASGLLDKQMAPGYLQGYDDMRAKGQGLLNQPIAGNGFNKFFPGR